MTDKRKRAKDGPAADPLAEMRERYRRAVDADRDNRELGLDDLRFVTVPGAQWDEAQKKARKNRPCYEFPILRGHWRQVVNDQKKARPGIKVRAVEDGDVEGAELRQGLIRNIESVSNAERAYDGAFELLTAAGFGAFQCVTEYSSDDAWEQDLRIKAIPDPLSTVWPDPDAREPGARDMQYCFVEESISREEFERRWPEADAVSFETSHSYGDWFGEQDVRIAQYWRMVPFTRTIVLLSDGRSVDSAELTPEMADQLAQQGVSSVRTREVRGHKPVVSIVSGKEELEGPVDSVFKKIPIILIYGNRFLIEGKWIWSGMVRSARDAQKLANYNLTTGQETLAKQHKAVPVVTAKMLEGKGVKALWDASNAVELPYLPITPDPQMPGGPVYLSPPPTHAAFVQMGQMSIDLVKSATGIYDASLGARSNETSGRAIIARQKEGDTATFDYQDALAFGIQTAGELLLDALPKVYDTPRAVRVLGRDGGEKWVRLYEQTQDGRVLNDLSAGQYDVTVSTGPAYDTMRMEFVDALTQLGQGNPAIAASVPDLIVGALDFPKADEAAERLKLMLPPPIQQAMQQGAQMPPEMAQAMAQAQGMMQQAQQAMSAAQQAGLQAEQAQAAVMADQAAVQSALKELNAQKQVFDTHVKERMTALQNAQLQWELQQARHLSQPEKPDLLPD